MFGQLFNCLPEKYPATVCYNKLCKPNDRYLDSTLFEIRPLEQYYDPDEIFMIKK